MAASDAEKDRSLAIALAYAPGDAAPRVVAKGRGLIAEEIIKPAKLRRTCKHEGETQQHCSKCGADIRVIASYECRLCAIMNKSKIYPAADAPKYCPQCGAPKFTFNAIKKKRPSH